ncbi:hypothetical protein N7452_004130 [Penicillium brevicompactum]|uniref:Zn(2)-C6 fungal-type domain-containing protein n=1 Tax=Penicillium brevicompactum TaxID=5074 RepID=A0A9W9QUW5_PENBR|nr:hypothetical protein N7452_004130 [Penicillium brevicompactum]
MNPEHPSNHPENESTLSNYDLNILFSSQPSAFDFSADSLTGPDEVATCDRPNTKVQIPRIAHPGNLATSGRVSRACENCRAQKAKCSGHRPTCDRCKDAGVRCLYGDRKGEKMAKQLSDLTTQVEAYKTLLQDLYPRLDKLSARHVDQTLQKLSYRLIPHADPEDTALTYGAIDYTEEDFNGGEELQAMGFVGEHSEIAWLYRLKRDLDQYTTTPTSNRSDRLSISSVNYFQDDFEISMLDDVDLSISPPHHVATQLVDNYFHTVHPAFPIVGMTTFIGQYNSFYANPNVRPGKRWLAVLNLIFAITARHLLLMGLPPHPEADSYLVYFTRAWRLGIDNVALLSHPNLQQVQVEGLAAFYLLSVGQINRSWRIFGIAIQSAVAMGLNLRNENDVIGHLSKETRYRVWWALFMLDTVLCVMTGRPPSTGETFCSTPLPLPYTEENFSNERIMQLISDQEARNVFMSSLLSTDPAIAARDTFASRLRSAQSERKGKQVEQNAEAPAPNISLYFLCAVDLAFLTRQTVDTLWLSRLPTEFHFNELDATQPFARERASLAFRFYTTKLIISQPCLRRLSDLSVAGKVLDLLPDEVDTVWLYKVTPWWCILHHIMQSSTILLIALYTRVHPIIANAAIIVKKVKKATRWLNGMSAKDPSSQRAWLICMDLLTRHASQLGLDVDRGS